MLMMDFGGVLRLLFHTMAGTLYVCARCVPQVLVSGCNTPLAHEPVCHFRPLLRQMGVSTNATVFAGRHGQQTHQPWQDQLPLPLPKWPMSVGWSSRPWLSSGGCQWLQARTSKHVWVAGRLDRKCKISATTALCGLVPRAGSERAAAAAAAAADTAAAAAAAAAVAAAAAGFCHVPIFVCVLVGYEQFCLGCCAALLHLRCLHLPAVGTYALCVCAFM